MSQGFQEQVQPQFTIEGSHVVMSHQDQTGLPQVKDATVNDRDRMQDLLAQEKYLSSRYDVAVHEASHDDFYQAIRQNQETCHELSRKLYNLMFKKGWYKVPLADPQSIAHEYQHFSQYRTQLPFPSAIGQRDAAREQLSVAPVGNGRVSMAPLGARPH